MFDQALFASAPSWDGKWLSALLRAGDHPRHELCVRKSDEAFMEAARSSLGTSIPDEEIARLVTEIINQFKLKTPAHGALPDAVLELERLNAVRAEALFRRQTHTRN